MNKNVSDIQQMYNVYIQSRIIKYVKAGQYNSLWSEKSTNKIDPEMIQIYDIEILDNEIERALLTQYHMTKTVEENQACYIKHIQIISLDQDHWELSEGLYVSWSIEIFDN